MTTTNAQILEALGACSEGLAEAAAYPTLREWWSATGTHSHMMWLIGRAHSHGTLPRRRLVSVAVACVATVAHLLDEASLPHLATVASWASGDDDVTDEDLRKAREALWASDAAAAARAAFYAAASAASAADAYAARAAFSVAFSVATDAADAFYSSDAAVATYAADAAANAAADAAMCDVIRDAISIDELGAALGLDPDQGVK